MELSGLAFLATTLNLLLLAPNLAGIAASAPSPPAVLYPKAALPTESGYLHINSTTTTTNSSSDSLFFAFYEAENPLTPLSETPIILWLQGGPGCSSMIGNLFEFGPYLLSSGHLLQPNPFSWNRRFALLFIDSPHGTGFSSSSSPDTIPRDQPAVAAQLFTALQSFFTSHPTSFRSRPLVIAGESYGAKFAASASYHILSQNPLLRPSLRINLAGVSIGNGMTVPIDQVGTHAATAYYAGLINDLQRGRIEGLQTEAQSLIREGKWSAATSKRTQTLSELRKATGLATLLDISRKQPYATKKLVEFLNMEEVKASLGVGKMTTWIDCSTTVRRAFHDDVMKSVKFMLEEIVRNTRLLLYQGNLDLKDGVASVEAWLKNMEWEGIGKFLKAEREVWRVEGEVAGYVQRWGNLTEVVVSGAGHMAPADQGKSTQAMIEAWVLQSGEPFGKWHGKAGGVEKARVI